MQRQTGGVDVVKESLGDTNNPSCDHGPTLLFERVRGGELRRFYACSACRNRKQCDFFRWADQPQSNKLTKTKKKAKEDTYQYKQYKQRLNSIKKSPPENRVLCEDCGLLLLAPEVEGHTNQGHKLRSGITNCDLKKPTYLLRALDTDKTNAQYFFSEDALQFIISTLERLKFQKVLCIGTPRVHEAILVNNRRREGRVESLLLDIDNRLEQFYTKKKFCHYNMFNHHFFRGDNTRRIYEDYLVTTPGSRLVVVMDPPFGGLVEILAHTVSQITQDWQRVNKVSEGTPDFLWIFPYFMRRRIEAACPQFNMLDYKVEYDNHDDFGRKAKAVKRGSPVRIFTTLSPREVALPEERYRFCNPCQRFTFKDVTHCSLCDACTSLDGRQFSHCAKCRRCVKPSWCHCQKCDMCHLPEFDCQKESTGCHLCGEKDHKRSECPEKSQVEDRNHKRKRDEDLKTPRSDRKRWKKPKKKRKLKSNNIEDSL